MNSLPNDVHELLYDSQFKKTKQIILHPKIIFMSCDDN